MDENTVATAFSIGDPATWTPEAVGPLVLAWAWPIAKALAILVIGWMLSKWIGGRVLRGLRSRGTDESLSRFLGNLAQYTALIMTVIAALAAVGIPTTSVVAVFASAGLAVGLALQGSLANFAAGVMILFFRPFTLEDLVQVAGHEGFVKDIGLFATTLVTADNQKIIIPNSKVTGESIVNLTTLGIRRAEIDIGVAYGEDMKKVQEILMASAKKCSMVLEEPATGLAFVNFGASSLDFKLMPWCKSEDFLDVLHAVKVQVYEDLNAADVDIPYDQVVMHQAS